MRHEDGPRGDERYKDDEGRTIFILEDETDIARLIAHHLDASGFATRTFSAPTDVLVEAEHARPALFLLDIMVPGGSGLDLCRRLRTHAALASVPIIFLTARVSENDRVRGLDLGADDYIPKPFSTRELVARVRAVLRRSKRPLAPSITAFGDVEIDQGAMELRVGGRTLATTTTEFRLLDFLARHPNRVYSRDQLLDAVWGGERFVTPRSVDVYVRRIREKIESNPEDPRYLVTVRGAGYRFEIAKSREPKG